MESYDILGSETVATPAGAVEISVALHPGGSVSAVAWLVATGQRVGWLRSGTWVRMPRAITVNRTVVGPELAATMARILMQMLERLPHMPLVGPHVASSGSMQEREVKDLRGLQWLLAELGEHYELDELAVRTGLVPGTDEVIASAPSGAWQRPRPEERPAAPAMALVEGDAPGAAYA